MGNDCLWCAGKAPIKTGRWHAVSSVYPTRDAAPFDTVACLIAYAAKNWPDEGMMDESGWGTNAARARETEMHAGFGALEAQALMGYVPPKADHDPLQDPQTIRPVPTVPRKQSDVVRPVAPVAVAPAPMPPIASLGLAPFDPGPAPAAGSGPRGTGLVVALTLGATSLLAILAGLCGS